MRLHGHIYNVCDSTAEPLLVTWRTGMSIGKGGEGNVFPVIGQSCAIKILNTYSNQMVCKLMHEIFWNVAMQRSGCAVVPFEHVFVAAETESPRIVGVVMPRFNASLRSFNGGWAAYLKKNPTADESEYKRQIAVAFCHAVRTLHDSNFAHNDLKLGNAVVRWNTLNVKIIDFSLASAARFDKEKVNGTYAYSFADSKTAVDNDKTDCFSAGITLMAFWMPEKYAVSIITSSHPKIEKFMRNHLRNFLNDLAVSENAVGALFREAVEGLTRENAAERLTIADAYRILSRAEPPPVQKIRPVSAPVMSEANVREFLQRQSDVPQDPRAEALASYIFSNGFIKKPVLEELSENAILEFCKTIGFRCWEGADLKKGVKRKYCT